MRSKTKRMLTTLLVPGALSVSCHSDFAENLRDSMAETSLGVVTDLIGEVINETITEVVNPSVKELDIRPETLSSGLEAIIVDTYKAWWTNSEDRPQTKIDNDSENRPFIIYANQKDGNLSFAKHDGSKWIGGVVSDRAGAAYCSLVLDKSDVPHIASTGGADGGAGESLLYFTARSNGWASKVVDISASVGLENSMAIDNNGFVHISHWSWAEDSLKYSTNKSGRWVNETLGPAGWSQTSVVLDSQNNIHISFTKGTEIAYINNASGNWEESRIVDGGYNATMQMDSKGWFHIASSDTSGLYYSFGRDNEWTTERVVDNNSHYIVVNYTPNIALSRDSPVIVYVGSDENYSSVPGELCVVAKREKGWRQFVLDNKLGYMRPDVSTDRNGDVHISTIFSVNKEENVLKYVAFDFANIE